MMDKLGHETPKEDHDAIRHIIDEQMVPRSSAIEVGCWTGLTTAVLAEIFADKVYAVDHWCGVEKVVGVPDVVSDDEVFRTFCNNLKRWLFWRVVPCRGPSLLWASVWPENYKAEFIFIDASHDYESVKADIAAWWPHLENGGIMCGHDFNTHDGVRRAVDEFGKDGVIANVWWRQK